jgi:tetratricopeptide (TPR) repeat protein
MTAMTEDQAALELVHEGWSHLQLQRPLAAWASWHRALRRAPAFPAATQALATLESALELPAAARAVYRFMPPADAAARTRWKQRVPDVGNSNGNGDGNLDDAAAAFASLAAADAGDAAAAFNEGLCFAWLGRNTEAIAALDRAVRVLAATDFDRATMAWMLAEVLRQGGGAEALADDLSYAGIIDDPPTDAIRLLGQSATLVPVAIPRDPASGEQLRADTQVFEWLDRPLPAGDAEPPRRALVPRLLATLVLTPRALRVSSPDPHALEAIDEPLGRLLGAAFRSIRRTAVPLPLPLLDAAVWTFRLPPRLERPLRDELTREAVESYFEDRWIHVNRKGLDGLSPLEAAHRIGEDVVLRARLTAVVRFREQLGARPRTAELYQGYPFDRLRRRLGLPLNDPEAVDVRDVSCASAAELDRLDPATLDDVRLADAFESAAGLHDDYRTARFAAVLARLKQPPLCRLELPAVFAPLVRQAMAAGQPAVALEWLDRARALEPEQRGSTFEVWRAEVYSRSSDPDAALRTYQAILEGSPRGAAVAMDAALTLLDNGYEEHARVLLRHARRRALEAGDAESVARVASLLHER